MEISWLLERLDNPALLQKGDEQRLRELIASYPYFSAPYLLLARSLHEQKHPAFEQLLPLISLQAFDRKRLFRLIHEETMDHRPWTIAEEETRGQGDKETGRLGDEENDMVRHLSEEPVLSLPKESATDEPESLDEEMRGLGDEGKKEMEDVGAEHFLPDSDVETKSESPAASPRFAVNFNEIEKTSEESVPAVHDELQEIPFLLTIDHGPWTIAEEETKGRGDLETGRLGDEENDIVRHTERSRSATDEPESSDEEKNESPNHKSQIINHKSDRIDFIHWLEKLQPVKKAEEIRGSGDEETGRRGDLETRRLGDEENDIVRHLSEDSVLSLTETKSLQPAAYSLQPDPNALIDKFIETNPSVSRVKERFYDPAVQARESERLDDSLITETLARIFVKQEKYERAIDAYRKLQLKYPEKSDYFAALILEINSKIN